VIPKVESPLAAEFEGTSELSYQAD
jgi:hypothetical protein